MATSGVILLGYVVAHLIGNLKIFTGEEHFDEYAEFLRKIGNPILGHGWFLWMARPVLLAALIVHVVSATQLALISRRARPVRYEHPGTVQATYASRTMRWGGVIILLFVIYHLLDLTFGTVNPDFVHGEVYDNVVASFQNEVVAAFYILSVAALGMHLYHGIWSMFQSLGRNSPKVDLKLRTVSRVLAALIVVGYVSIPVAVMIGVID